MMEENVDNRPGAAELLTSARLQNLLEKEYTLPNMTAAHSLTSDASSVCGEGDVSSCSLDGVHDAGKGMSLVTSMSSSLDENLQSSDPAALCTFGVLPKLMTPEAYLEAKSCQKRKS